MTPEGASIGSRLASFILHSGLDDWVALNWIENWAVRAGVQPGDETKELVLGVLEVLVNAGSIELGGVSDQGYTPWTEPLDVMLSKIDLAWSTSGPYQYGFILWIRNTQKGDELARQEAALRD